MKNTIKQHLQLFAITTAAWRLLGALALVLSVLMLALVPVPAFSEPLVGQAAFNPTTAVPALHPLKRWTDERYLLSIIIALLLIAFWVIHAYNSLAKTRQQVAQAQANINRLFTQRNNLVSKLVDTIKSRIAPEQRALLDEVTQTREAAVAAQEPPQIAAAQKQLSAALRSVWALEESSPDLKANISFQHLQSELTRQEDKLAIAQRAFNRSAHEYNTARALIPAVWFAGICGFTRQQL